MPNLRDWAWPLAIGAAALSVLGGVLGLLPRARLTLGQYRPAGDAAAGSGQPGGADRHAPRWSARCCWPPGPG